jgi:UDP-2,4-diacetamido-2,4,6-trideoxy-beta-L-altropyranose hydrolase
MQIPRTMNVLIRADASVRIGSGHVMRCLTLADELRANGATVRFASRDFEGNLCAHIASKGYAVDILPRPTAWHNLPDDEYAQWLGVPLETDAAETIIACTQANTPIAWLITDHYAIDARWHRLLRPHVGQIMVIDDIANRAHDCDLLLDQNLYDNAEYRYTSRVPAQSQLLLGPEYALLRPEFRETRERVGERLLKSGKLERIFVFFGGTDPSNETAKVVHALGLQDIRGIQADIVVGIANPHRHEIEQLCAALPNCTFHCQVSTMAELMMKSDIALGAGGSTTWERCSLGLPTLAIIIAENQAEMTETAARHGLQWNLGWHSSVTPEIIAEALRERAAHPEEVREYSRRGYALVDGLGAKRVAKQIYSLHHELVSL